MVITLVDKEIEEYAVAKSEPTDNLLKELVGETYKRTTMPQMLCGPIEGRFLKLLVQITGAKRVLEVGMFTGYSALSMAEGLPEGGELITCEIDPEVIRIAQSYFDRSPHGKKITIKQGAGLDTIESLQAPFDVVFIDADKTNYLNYYKAVLPLVRSGGVICVDNVLWGGSVLSPKDEDGKAIAALNEFVAADTSVDRVLLPVRDGIFVIRKK